MLIPSFCWSYAPWNLENICKSTNNLSFLCLFFINEITASDAGADIIRSHLFFHVETSPLPMKGCKIEAYAHQLRQLNKDGSLSCHSCGDTGPPFLWSHTKDAPIRSPVTRPKGFWGIIPTWIPTRRIRRFRDGRSSVMEEILVMVTQIYLNILHVKHFKLNCELTNRLGVEIYVLLMTS